MTGDTWDRWTTEKRQGEGNACICPKFRDDLFLKAITELETI
jgi:hypothetical protein